MGGLHNLIGEKVAQDKGYVRWRYLVLDPTKEQINIAPSSSVFIFISLHLHQSSSSSVFIFISLHLHQSSSLPSPVVRINLHLFVSTKSIILQYSFKHVFSRFYIGNGPRPSKPYKANVPRIRRFGSTKTMCGYQCYGRLASDPSKTWSHRYKVALCEFATCTIAGDQLRISLSPTLLAELKGNLLRHERHVLDISRNRSLTEHILNSVFSRSLEPSTVCSPSSIQQLRLMASTAILQESLEVPSVPLLNQAQLRAASLRRGSGEGRGHQDGHKEISSDGHYSVNTNCNHNTCDTGDEDPRPAKRRKPRAALG
ncbi:uncharacterized protein PAC_18140 [Phialocephala subalpina]|uniref:Uncharacterized protein n=1 Tax=Phialocephala subalpina TaxID=576137 RepID=A0A1L7XT74_9HELO|nr:uncharacterized protein PAC_18140 [Phialocephala subalpina]